MPKIKKQTNFFTRLTHAVVGFLAFSSALRLVAGEDKQSNQLINSVIDDSYLSRGLGYSDEMMASRYFSHATSDSIIDIDAFNPAVQFDLIKDAFERGHNIDSIIEMLREFQHRHVHYNPESDEYEIPMLGASVGFVVREHTLVRSYESKLYLTAYRIGQYRSRIHGKISDYLKVSKHAELIDHIEEVIANSPPTTIIDTYMTIYSEYLYLQGSALSLNANKYKDELNKYINKYEKILLEIESTIKGVGTTSDEYAWIIASNSKMIVEKLMADGMGLGFSGYKRIKNNAQKFVFPEDINSIYTTEEGAGTRAVKSSHIHRESLLVLLLAVSLILIQIVILPLLRKMMKEDPLKPAENLERAMQEARVKKVKEEVPVDPELLAKQEEERAMSLKAYTEQQAKIRAEREAEEKVLAEARKKAKELEAKRQNTLENTFNRVYKTLSALKSDRGSVENLFKGPSLRQSTLNKILEGEVNYFIEGSNEIDQKHLAKDILHKIGLDRSAPLYLNLVEQFTEIYEKGEDAVRARKAQEAAEAARQAREEAARREEEQRLADEQTEREEQERMNLEKTLRSIEKGKGKAKQAVATSSSSSSSSSSSVMTIGFTSQEAANKVRQLVLQLGELLNEYNNPKAISNDLFVLKHDLIRICAVTEQLVKGGGRAIVTALLNYSNLMVIRNGALHLLEINTDEGTQIKFYQDVLVQLGSIASVGIDETAIKKGLNSFLNQVQQNWNPVDFNDQLSHEMYESFQADSQIWKDDHEKKTRSDVMDAIDARNQSLKQTDTSQPKKRIMIIAEMAELYNQLKNTGAQIPGFAHRMIAAKNEFAHEGKPIALSNHALNTENSHAKN